MNESEAKRRLYQAVVENGRTAVSKEKAKQFRTDNSLRSSSERTEKARRRK